MWIDLRTERRVFPLQHPPPELFPFGVGTLQIVLRLKLSHAPLGADVQRGGVMFGILLVVMQRLLMIP